jgi:hypothetical protein
VVAARLHGWLGRSSSAWVSQQFAQALEIIALYCDCRGHVWRMLSIKRIFTDKLLHHMDRLRILSSGIWTEQADGLQKYVAAVRNVDFSMSILKTLVENRLSDTRADVWFSGSWKRKMMYGPGSCDWPRWNGCLYQNLGRNKWSIAEDRMIMDQNQICLE